MHQPVSLTNPVVTDSADIYKYFLNIVVLLNCIIRDSVS